MGQTKPAKRLGVDFGGVLQGGHAPGDRKDEDTFFGDKYIDAPPTPGAIEAVRQLVQRFEGRVWIVSKAGFGVQRKTLQWLGQPRFGMETTFDLTKILNFWDAVGMEPWSITFVRERADKAKVAAELRLTHFIDDRIDVLEAMADLADVKRYWFNPPRDDEGTITTVPERAGVVALHGWADVALVQP